MNGFIYKNVPKYFFNNFFSKSKNYIVPQLLCSFTKKIYSLKLFQGYNNFEKIWQQQLSKLTKKLEIINNNLLHINLLFS